MLPSRRIPVRLITILALVFLLMLSSMNLASARYDDDAGTGQDAQNSLTDAMPMPEGNFSGEMGSNIDGSDCYQDTLTPGTPMAYTVTKTSPDYAPLFVFLMTPDGTILADSQWPPGNVYDVRAIVPTSEAILCIDMHPQFFDRVATYTVTHGIAIVPDVQVLNVQVLEQAPVASPPTGEIHKPETKRVQVTLRNPTMGDAPHTEVRLIDHGYDNLTGTFVSDERVDVPAGTTRTFTFTWSGTGRVGTLSLNVDVFAWADTDPTNNHGSTQASFIAPGPGVDLSDYMNALL